APRVIAKGKGKSAENIIKIAELHNLPIKKDEDLIELLSKVELDKEVPAELYRAVAEVFSFIYKVTNK
ncbi:MAG: EscU/YscU/HrcU family type III secretion system export apparatus switch protein, partial [Campylobacterota bacterium]|nr:EscU/YscU/HrcU family type III secretion system export apparatus switch protein [Campylobacterota bacterium]